MHILYPTIESLAKTFWQDAGIKPTYPIDLAVLEHAICFSKNLSIVKLSKLTIGKIAEWFNQKQFSVELPKDEERSLYGFLFAHQGVGFAFINGCDSRNEQCYTLSHELAHYILDYELPRQKIIKRFGPSIVEVIDGIRVPTLQEQLSGLLSYVPTKPISHLLDTPASSGFDRLKVWKIEERADQLSLEILAPMRAISSDVRRNKIEREFEVMKDFLEGLLENQYALPLSMILPYANHLAHIFCGGGKSLSEQWGIKY